MTLRKKKSKKPSDTKLSPDERLKSFVFFIDRSLGSKKVPDKLREAGLKVELHKKYFAPDAPDIEWLEKCGTKRWVALAKDKAIKRNELERRALFNAEIAAFFLTSGELSGDEMAQAIIKALEKVADFLENQKRPFIARITPQGKVELWIDHKDRNRLT